MNSPQITEPVSNAVTDGIRITVQSIYIPEQSAPDLDRFVFAYNIVIANEGDSPAQLRTRHWIITDAHGSIEEVHGPGVVGETPRLEPGQSFQYTSGCVLRTSSGTMQGTYQMFRDNERSFDAEIATFALCAPVRPADHLLN